MPGGILGITRKINSNKNNIGGELYMNIDENNLKKLCEMYADKMENK